MVDLKEMSCQFDNGNERLIRHYTEFIHSRTVFFVKGGMGHLSVAGILHPSECISKHAVCCMTPTRYDPAEFVPSTSC